jgi:outer membrane protein assembly factor BamB
VRRKLLVALGLILVIAAGAFTALFLKTRDRPQGKLDTELSGVSSVAVPTKPAETPQPKKARWEGEHLAHDKRCWLNFGGDPQRSLSRPDIDIGKPIRHLWVRGFRSYIEYPPSYCDGILYVNTGLGRTLAINSHNGHTLWIRKGARKPSTPAIAGSRLIVTAHDGTVSAYNRFNGRPLWRLKIDAKVESSPVAVKRVVYFGATDGRLFAVYVRTGRVKWAYDTGGRINASPSIYRNRIFISTYAGSIYALRVRDGHKIWSRYLRRDLLRYESFYASPSTDGHRVYVISRSGGVYALTVRSGKVVWKDDVNSWGYSTPAIAHGRVFIGDFNGGLRAYSAGTGRLLWRNHVGGRFLGGALVAGNLVFASTLERRTYAFRVGDGKLVWRLRVGQYSPGIVTERHYYFTLNGILSAWDGRRSPQVLARTRAKRLARLKQSSTKKGVTTSPKG